MNADEWARVKAIFHDVVEREPTERAEYLLQSCGGDRDLQREVESLLAFDSNGDASSILDKPAFAATALLPESAPNQSPFTLKDRYTVVRELGRGGMRAVYRAQDRQLLSKFVVVKVLLKETSQDPWVRQKFKQEMEALARIDHPGVVGVLDTGLTAEGHQFLVMRTYMLFFARYTWNSYDLRRPLSKPNRTKIFRFASWSWRWLTMHLGERSNRTRILRS